MKKIICFLFATILLVGCSTTSDTSIEEIVGNDSTEMVVPFTAISTSVASRIIVKVVEIEGHKYLISVCDVYHGGGISTIHAESCDCVKEKMEEDEDV